MSKDLLRIYGQKAPIRRTETPFLDDARSGNQGQERNLRIALAHGIIDKSQVASIGQLELAAMVAKLMEGQAVEPPKALTEEEKVEKRIMRKWLPKEKKYKP